VLGPFASRRRRELGLEVLLRGVNVGESRADGVLRVFAVPAGGFHELFVDFVNLVADGLGGHAGHVPLLAGCEKGLLHGLARAPCLRAGTAARKVPRLVKVREAAFVRPSSYGGTMEAEERVWHSS